MKKVFILAGIVMLGVLGWWLLHKSGTPESVSAAKTASENPVQPKVVSKTNFSQAPEIVSPASTEPLIVATTDAAQQTNAVSPTLAPAVVLDNCRVFIHHFHDTFGENPVGNNAEITAALTGQNPRQINFIREDAGLRMNGQGELLDGWGTPFFFHQVSKDVMEIHSAGPDRKLWTLDDQVIK